MKNTKYKIILFTFLAIFIAPTLSYAHQPRIIKEQLTEVINPEVSKAYYATLVGVPDVYVIKESEAFDLYVNVLVPDIVGQKKDVSAVILKNGTELATLDGTTFGWKKFYEPFGVDTYWMGPEYKARAEAGIYEIKISSPENNSKYSLAVGEREAFDSKEVFNALTVIPELKRNFFNESPIGFIASPFGWGLIVAMYLLAGVFGLIYRFILKRVAKGTVRGLTKNIGTSDRLIRFVIGAALLFWAITTSWSPWLLFFSGFALFEALFSWCGFYAALGKNTCPVT